MTELFQSTSDERLMKMPDDNEAMDKLLRSIKPVIFHNAEVMPNLTPRQKELLIGLSRTQFDPFISPVSHASAELAIKDADCTPGEQLTLCSLEKKNLVVSKPLSNGELIWVITNAGEKALANG